MRQKREEKQKWLLEVARVAALIKQLSPEDTAPPLALALLASLAVLRVFPLYYLHLSGQEVRAEIKSE